MTTTTDRPAPARAPRGPRALRHRGFGRLAGAWVFTNLGDSVLYLIAAVWVKDLTGSDALAAGVFIALGASTISAPFLGQLADRVRRRPLLVAANELMVPVLAVLLLVDADRVWLVWVVILVYGAIGVLTGAAQGGLVRDLLPDDALASGNGVLATVDQAARLVAPLLGTALYVAFGMPSVVIVAMAAFAVAAVLLATLRVDETPPAPASERGRYLTELAAGARHLFGTPELALLTVVIVIAFAATGFLNVAVLPALEQGFRVDAAWLGPISTVQGVGALAGGTTAAAVIGRIGERRTVAVGVAVLGLGVLPIAGSWLPLGVVGAALIGLGVVWTVVAFQTARQRLTPATLQGRTAAAANVSINVPQTVAMAAGAGLLLVVDYRIAIVATAVLVLASAVAALLVRRGGR